MNGMVCLTTILKKIRLFATDHVSTQMIKHLLSSLNKIVKVYARGDAMVYTRNFKMFWTNLDCCGQHDSGKQAYCTGKKGHEIVSIKKCNRCVFSELPSTRALLLHLV